MDKAYNNKQFKSFLPYFLLALAIIIAYKSINELNYFVAIIKKAWYIITPFFYGFLLAYIMNIPCSGLQKLLAKSKINFINKRRKPLSIFLTALILIIIILSILNLIIPAIYSNVSLFISNTPTYYDRLLDFVDYINGLDIIGLHISIDKIMAMVEETLQGLNLDNILSSINALLGFSSAVFNIFLAFISSIYILVEKDKFKTFLRRLLTVFSTSGAYAAIIKYAGKLNKNFKQYIYTQTIDGLIIGSLSAIELYLLGSPYALVLGLTLGLINYIPYFGSIIGSIIAVMIVAFTQGLPTGAIAAVVLIVTQQIDGNIIQPRLMGDSFSLSPLLIIISITIGEAVAGVLGMIAAIPIIAVLKDIFESIIVYYERKKSDSKD